MSYIDLLSNDPSKVSSALDKAIKEDNASTTKSKAREGIRYYDYEHDILNNRIFYFDDNGTLKEDEYASNIKIPHAFHTELVDQKVQYLLSNPVEVITEDEELQEYLEEYYDEDFQVFLQDTLEGASNKGFEYIFARTTAENKLTFQVSDSLKTFDIYDNSNNRVGVVRHYDKEITKDGKKETITYAEIWTDESVTFYVKDKNKSFELDPNRENNPRPHVLGKDAEGAIYERSYGRIPFNRLSNNKREKTDLEPIKALIDDYDIMAAYLSNNLQDFTDAIYVVKGFKGDNLSSLRQNIKAKKTVGVGTDGDVDIRTVEIPYEARQAKLEIDKDAIYKFGMGFDSTQIGDGNITNIVIKSRYALLDMKANKAEVRLRAMLKWINEMIVEDINRRHNTDFKASDIKIEIVRETMVNENDIVNNEKIEAETKQTIIETILAVAPRIGDEETLKLICELYDLDWEEIQADLEEEDYSSGLQDGTDPVEDDEDGEIEAAE